MGDIAWQTVLESGHWDHGGWVTDPRDGALVCSCGAVLRDGPVEAATG